MIKPPSHAPFAPLPSGLVQLSALLRSIGRYSFILPWRPLRPLRKNIILQSTHYKQRGAKSFDAEGS
jgi:hypothetical protein